MATMLFFLPLLPDEHYFSRIARMAVLTPTKSVADFFRSWFSVNQSVNPLKDYQAVCNGLITHSKATMCEDLLCGHTSAGFYSHFLDVERRRELIKGKAKCDRKKLFIPGLTKVQNANCWRACPQCIEEDIENFGTPYWHVSHQLPTAKVCTKHVFKTLIAGCNGCGWENIDLRKNPLPVTICPKCNHDMQESSPTATEENVAIQSMGQELHLNSCSLQRPMNQRQMLRSVEHAFGRAIRTRNQEYWETKTQVEHEFWDWVMENQIGSYFNINTEAELHELLRLESVISSPSKVTPMAHIIWLAFFNQIGQPNHAGLSLVS